MENIKEDTKKTFSIITATYNSEKTLERTIKSILNQTFKDFEYIIIDGKSTDSTLSIIKKYEEVFKQNNISFSYITEKDNGIYDAWNKGIKISRGEWISFLGSDDYYLNNALETYYNHIDNKYNYLHSKVKIVNEAEKVIKTIGIPLSKKNFFRYMEIAHVGSFHHKSLFEKELFSLKFKASSDYYFFIKNIENINALFIDSITAIMQFGGISTNINLSLKESLKVKLISKRRNKWLCYLDYILAYFKYYFSKFHNA